MNVLDRQGLQNDSKLRAGVPMSSLIGPFAAAPTLQCPKRLWLQTHQRELAEISPATQATFDTGHRVGEVARGLFPGGVLVGHVDNMPAALEETGAALRNRGHAVFEAAFSYRRMVIQNDAADLMS